MFAVFLSYSTPYFLRQGLTQSGVCQFSHTPWSTSPRDPLSLLPQCWINKHNCTNVSVFHPEHGCWDLEAQVLTVALQALY